MSQQAIKTLADYRPQHDEDCHQAAQSGWLIEHYQDRNGDSIQPEWWDGLSFRTNADHAIRFSREFDGKMMLSQLVGNVFAFDCRVTEHLWMSDRPCTCGLDALLAAVRDEQPIELLREALVAARDAMVAFQVQASVVPGQNGYSTTMTQAERNLADAIQAVNSIVERSVRDEQTRVGADAEALASSISLALAHGDRTHLGTVRAILADAVNDYRRNQVGNPEGRRLMSRQRRP